MAFRVLISFVISFLALYGLLRPAQAEDTIVLSTHMIKDSYNFNTTKVIMAEAFRRVGIKMTLRPTPGNRALHEAETGITDGDVHRIYRILEIKKLKNLIRVPETQQTISTYAWSKTITKIDNGWDSLKDLHVGVYLGSALLNKLAKKYAKRVSSVGTTEKMFRMLNGGRFDLAISAPSGAVHLNSPEYTNSGIRRLEPALRSFPVYTYLHKKHADLVPLVAEALHMMKLDGTYERLLNGQN